MISMSLRLNNFSEGKYFKAFPVTSSYDPRDCCVTIDSKTVCIFAYSSSREESNKRSGTTLKTESKTGERRFRVSLSPPTPYGRVRLARFARVRLLPHALPISLLILRKKTDCFAVYCVTNS